MILHASLAVADLFGSGDPGFTASSVVDVWRTSCDSEILLLLMRKGEVEAFMLVIPTVYPYKLGPFSRPICPPFQ
jgi:hypothetical protein